MDGPKIEGVACPDDAGVFDGKANFGTSGLVLAASAGLSTGWPSLNPPKPGVDCVVFSVGLGPNKLVVPDAPNMLGLVPLVDAGACVLGCVCACEDVPPVLAPNIKLGGCPAGVVDEPPRKLELPAGAGVVEPNVILGAED